MPEGSTTLDGLWAKSRRAGRPRTRIQRGAIIQQEWAGIVLGCFAAAYVVANMWVASRLWFWWDELTIIKSQSEEFKGILQGHQGNYLPLGRIALIAETRVFGPWYPGYVAVNSILTLLIVGLTYSLVRRCLPAGGQATLLLVASLSIYPLSTGVLYNVQWGMQFVWLLSVTSVLFGAYVVVNRGRPFYWAWIAFLISWLALGSNILPATMLMAALVLLSPDFRKRTTIVHLATMLLIAGGLTLLSTQLAALNPPSDPTAHGAPIVFAEGVSEWFEVLRWAGASASAWVLSPVSLVLPSVHQAFLLFGHYLFYHPAAIVAVVLLLIAIPYGTGAARTWAWHPVLLLAPLVTMSLMVSIRGYQGLSSDLAARYGSLSLLPAVVFWPVVALGGSGGRLRRLISAGLIVLLFATALLSFARTPLTISRSSDKGRIDVSIAQNELMSECWGKGTTTVLPQIQPVMTGDELCAIVRRLDAFRPPSAGTG